jgi:MFS family permease
VTTDNLSGPTQSAGERVQQSDGLGWVARVGLVAYGLVYVLIGWLAVQLALGDRSGAPSSSGALRELAQQPFGGVLIWAVSLGMLLLVGWQLLEAAFGHRDVEGKKRLGRRLAAVGKAGVYGFIGGSGLRIAVGSGSSSTGEETLTARLMSLPAGQVLVGLVGLAIIGFGIFQLYWAWTEGFTEKLDGEGRRGTSGTAYVAFGKAGYAARGIAFGIVGGLFCYAALTHESSKSGGLDQALAEILDQPFGPVLLSVVGVGLACFGLFTFAQARHLSR